MKLYSLGFFVTDDCNFDCSYCSHTRKKQNLHAATIEKTVDFFFPYLADEDLHIAFYGGEPLLAFHQIRHTVMRLHEKNKEAKKPLRFTTTTNGSLLTEEILSFFNRHNFFMMLSFDGLNQERTRMRGSLESTLALMQRLSAGEYTGIGFACNSVFSPESVNRLSQSIRYLVEAGGAGVRFRLAEDQPWDEAAIDILELELEKLNDYLISYFSAHRSIPLENYRPGEKKPTAQKKTFFKCDGGYHQMAVGPGEELWGCVKIHSYLRDKQNSNDYRAYSFGKLDDFIKNHETIYPRVLKNYANLRQDFFFTGDQDCFLCPELSQCSCCPIYAANATSYIGKIPTWHCHLRRVKANAYKRFREKLDRIKPLHNRVAVQ